MRQDRVGFIAVLFIVVAACEGDRKPPTVTPTGGPISFTSGTGSGVGGTGGAAVTTSATTGGNTTSVTTGGSPTSSTSTSATTSTTTSTSTSTGGPVCTTCPPGFKCVDTGSFTVCSDGLTDSPCGVNSDCVSGVCLSPQMLCQ